MSIVTFWSSQKRQVGQSLSAAAVATYMGMEHNDKILLISTEYGDDALERAFGSSGHTKKMPFAQSSNVGLDSGINGIAKLVSANRLEPNLIKDYTRIAFRDRLEILYAPRKGSDYPKLLSMYKEIITTANRYYDLVIVDLNKGLAKPEVREILEISDIVVVCLEQRISKLQEYLTLKTKEPLLQENNILISLGDYDKFSKCNTKNVEKFLKQRKGVFAVPYNTLYLEASDDGSVPDFFLRVRMMDTTDKNGIFMDELKKFSDGILYKIQELQMNR